MRTATCLSVLVAAALLGGTAQARPAPAARTCVVVSDPAADVAAQGAAPTAVVPDGHLDVRTVTLDATSSLLRVTIHDTKLDPSRHGIWVLTFANGRTRLVVKAGLGIWANVGDADATDGFRAGVAGKPTRTVVGHFDYTTSDIVVDVPFTAIGVRRGTMLRSFAIEATETFANVAPAPGVGAGARLGDTATSTTSVAVGGRC